MHGARVGFGQAWEEVGRGKKLIRTNLLREKQEHQGETDPGKNTNSSGLWLITNGMNWAE